MAIFFVLGTGRCGTRTLSMVLGSAPNCICCHEGANSELRLHLKPLTAEFQAALRCYGDNEALRELFGTERLTFIHDCAKQGKHFGEANHYANPFIEFLAHEYPEAKFIHLIRNGYETVVSWEARTRGIYPKAGKSVNHWAGAVPEPSPDDPWYGEWASFKRIQKIMWFWARENDFVDRALRRVALKRTMLVRLEELNEAKVDEIVDFVGLGGWDRERLRRHNASSKPLRRAWTARHLRQFREVAGQVADRFGYRVFGTEQEFTDAFAAVHDDVSPFIARSVPAR